MLKRGTPRLCSNEAHISVTLFTLNYRLGEYEDRLCQNEARGVYQNYKSQVCDQSTYLSRSNRKEEPFKRVEITFIHIFDDSRIHKTFTNVVDVLYKRKVKGPIKEPWGIPLSTGVQLELTSQTTKRCSHSEINLWIQNSKLAAIPKDFSLWKRENRKL